jgi:hypothetical protein
MNRYLSSFVAAVFIIGIGFVDEGNSNTYSLSPTDDSWVYLNKANENYGSDTGIATTIQSPRIP